MGDILEYDIVIAGAGPAGLSCAYRLKQKRPELRVCVLEKGPEAGAHILSGAVIDPVALNELIPDWKEKGAPVKTAVTKDRFYYLTKKRALPLPLPKAAKNHGNYIISLGALTRWLAEQAASIGVDIFPGFAAQEVLKDENGRIAGIRTGETGRDKSGAETASYQEGAEIRAKFTVLAEGCRGHVSERVMQDFQLRAGRAPQTYGIGIKETWRLPEEALSPGTVIHTVGWPLPSDTYGGSFMYHGEGGLLSIGYVTGLDYPNPYLDPYMEFQKFKTHPSVRPLLEQGKRIGYGARALNEGGFQSIPELIFPGGALIGCAAGFMNVPRIKGTHTAMYSAICLADALAEREGGEWPEELDAYPEKLRASFVYDELREVRNIRPAFKRGRLFGLAYSALDLFVLRGRPSFMFMHGKTDRECLKKAEKAKEIQYPKPDNTVTFDKLSSVALTGVQHNEHQPSHLKLRAPAKQPEISYGEYAGPEQRYCPAKVYEYLPDDDGEGASLQINASNCIHCKTCDIKDPADNIDWTAPEGGGGPRYTNM